MHELQEMSNAAMIHPILAHDLGVHPLDYATYIKIYDLYRKSFNRKNSL